MSKFCSSWVGVRFLMSQYTPVWHNEHPEHSWLVRERVFDVFPRGTQECREELIDLILRLYPSADVN